jgi:hypothetical protein
MQAAWLGLLCMSYNTNMTVNFVECAFLGVAAAHLRWLFVCPWRWRHVCHAYCYDDVLDIHMATDTYQAALCWHEPMYLYSYHGRLCQGKWIFAVASDAQVYYAEA